MKNRHIFHLLLFLLGSSFMVLYFVLAFHNRLPYEDYTFISMTKDWGVIKAVAHIYNIHSSRWAAHSLGFFFSSFHESRVLLPLFHSITLFLLLLSFFLLLKFLFQSVLNVKITKLTLAFHAVLLTCCFFFSSYSIGETWFWYMVNWMYLWSIIAGNFLLYVIFSKRKSIFYIPLIILLAAYIAGASESYAIIYILFFSFLYFLKQKRIFPAVSDKIRIQYLIISIAMLVLFSVFIIIAPGTWARKATLVQADFTEHLIMLLKAYGIVLIRYSPQIIVFLMLFGIPWLYLGQQISFTNSITGKEMIQYVLKYGLASGVIIFILILPASWVLYDVPPARALSQVSLLLTLIFSGLFFFIGLKAPVASNIKKYAATLALAAGIVFNVLEIKNQYEIVSAYSREYDLRIDRLKTENEKGRTKVLYFPPLPPSGMLYSDELSGDSLANNFLENVYNSKFHVALDSR